MKSTHRPRTLLCWLADTLRWALHSNRALSSNCMTAGHGKPPAPAQPPASVACLPTQPAAVVLPGMEAYAE